MPGSRNTGLIKKKFMHYSKWNWLATLAGLLLFTACENDLKAIRKISSQEVSKPISTTTGLDVIYSDSAHVKVHLKAPLLLDYIDKKFREMPKGVTIISYEHASGIKQSGQIVADYGIERQNDKIIELRRNVVATNAKGETFKSDELIWDQAKKEFYSNKQVDVTFATGTHLLGTNFKSDESMTHWTMGNTNGQIPVNQNFGQ
ncbi:LPS export ABC transporter periplasmic protein LptC [Mucilaginibacter sp. PAMB04168]|uniref:LPS export ABC transporter periplasmic protein LptC n=1 Tax=Mucilaginibacter sp. PAMB04168 TaxID=3138567 RepID=UPI0031F6B603